MCGRTCLTLEPQQIRCACKYKKTNKMNTIASLPKHEPEKRKENSVKNESQEEIYIQPEWRKEYNCGLDYTPCYNIAPQSVTPVLVSSYHFCDSDCTNGTEHERVIVPMLWGMIPFWHRGDYRKHGLTTNNCRLEHMLESKLYEGPFRRGQRCVVLCEGFYEWQTTKSAKPSERDAYLLYMPQQDGIEIWNKNTWTNCGDESNLNLLKLAGLFDTWTDSQGDKIFSYSVITFESSDIMSWLHHRMPAILETDQQVDDWLDYKRVPYKAALNMLHPVSKLQWHRVSRKVNNSRYKEAECNVPIELLKDVKPKSNMLKSWLLVRKRREDEISRNVAEDTDDDDDQQITSGHGDCDVPEQNVKRPRKYLN